MEILVPVDGSTAADAATRLAADLARKEHRLELLHVIDIRYVAPLMDPLGDIGTTLTYTEDDNDVFSVYAEEGRDVLETAAEICHDAGVSHLRTTAIGVPQETILKRSAEAGALVIAKQGFSTRELGATATAVVARASCPVITLRVHRSLERALLAVDDPVASRAVAETIAELLLPDETSVTVLVAEGDRAMRDAEPVIESLRDDGFRAHVAPERDVSAEAVLAAATSEDADLVAMGGAGAVRSGPLRREQSAVRIARRAACVTMTFPRNERAVTAWRKALERDEAPGRPAAPAGD